MNKHLKRLYDENYIISREVYIDVLEEAYIKVMDRIDERAAAASNSRATDWGSMDGVPMSQARMGG